MPAVAESVRMVRKNMSKLVLAVGRQSACIVKKARELGYRTAWLDDAQAGQMTFDAEAIAEKARAVKVDGIVTNDPALLDLVCRALQLVNLPGLSHEVARCLRDKTALRARLAEHGIPQPVYRAVYSREEAAAAARELGMPLAVLASERPIGSIERRVDYLADVSLAFIQVSKRSSSESVLIETYSRGEAYSVFGYVLEGRFSQAGLAAHERAPSPHRFPVGLFCPATVERAVDEAITALCQKALDAVGFDYGPVRVDVHCIDGELCIADIEGCPFSLWMPMDLIHLSTGVDFMGGSLRMAVGDCPAICQSSEGAAALYWLTALPGVVHAIEGVEQARKMAGTVEVAVSAKPGDIVRHIVDQEGQQRVGYVAATGAEVQEAVATAKRAQRCCRVATRAIHGDLEA